MMDTFLSDLKYAVRVLLKAPGFAVVAIVTLALGIGANTAMFSVIDAVLLRSANFRDPARLVFVWENNFARDGRRKPNVVSPANFYFWRQHNRSFEDVGAFFATPMNAVLNGEAVRLPGVAVTPNLLQVLGIQPVLGRAFAPDEELPGKDDVVMLSYSVWQQRFGGDPSIVGKDLNINGQPQKVVGIMPARTEIFEDVAMWTPITNRGDIAKRRGRYLEVVGRLKPGVSLQQAQADMDVVAANTRAESPDYNTGWGTYLVSLNDEMVGKVRPALLVLLGSVAFVLLIACANVANLLLARASARHKEIAIRCALGVRRARLARQLLTESVVLSLAGGVAGVALAYLALDAVLAIVPPALPGYASIRVNLPVLVFASAISLLTGVLFGLAPALRATRTDPQEALKQGGKGVSDTGHKKLRNLLVVIEAAMAIVLLIGAGLLIRSFSRLTSVDTGFQSDGVVTMQLTLSSRKYGKPASVVNYFQQVVDKVKAVPGVTSAAAITWLPMDGLGSATDFTVDDRPQPPKGEAPIGDVRGITEDYFRAMGISLLRGRTFDPSLDRAEDPVKKVIINGKAAERLWPGQDPIGKTITMEWLGTMHAQVIGVVNDVRLVYLNQANDRTTLYWYMPQFPSGQMSIVARTATDPKSMLSAIKSQVATADPEVPVARLRTMNEVIGRSVREPRFSTVLLGIFAALALVLAAVGLYGVISYSVTQRKHELGVRMALGAQPSRVARMVLGEGLALSLGGAAIGFLVALFVVRLLSTMLFGVSTHDVVTFAVVPVIVCAVAALACYIPARRATKIDPLVALRYE